MLQAVWTILLELAPWLLLGTAIAGLLHVALPAGFVERHLGGRFGVAKAVLLGVPLPLCSCGVIPAGLGLKKDGASDGASVGFLISTPQTGVDSILVSASFLGWPFALFKVVSAAVTGMVGGLLADRVSSGHAAPAGACLTDEGGAPRRSLRDGVAHGLDVLRTIWRWIVFGVLVSAAITAFVPPGAFAPLRDHGGVLAALAVLALSVPLYVCATASVPIAAALVAAGMPAGAALVFLMAGPATNVATIGAIHRGFGPKVLAVYLATIVVGSLGFGLAFDFLLETGGLGAVGHVHGGGPVAAASAAVLVALLVGFAAADLRDLARRLRPAPVASSAPIEVGVTGMSCQGCVRKLRGALEATEGVTSVEVELEPGRAVVRGSITEADVRAAITRAGYSPT